MQTRDVRQAQKLDSATLRRLAVEAECDPRTLVAEYRFQRGERPRAVRGMAGDRARRALRNNGFLP